MRAAADIAQAAPRANAAEGAGRIARPRGFTILDLFEEVYMKRPVPIAGALALLSVIALSQDQSVREITRQELRDKIEG